MLKTNCKKVNDFVKAFIIAHYTPENYEIEKTDDFKQICQNIWNIFISERGDEIKRYKTYQNLFIDYLQGLPSIIDTDYYYQYSANDLLGELLEQTEKEKAKYTEMQSEYLFSYLIFKQITKNIDKF